MLELITAIIGQKHWFLLGSRMPLEGWLVMTGQNWFVSLGREKAGAKWSSKTKISTNTPSFSLRPKMPATGSGACKVHEISWQRSRLILGETRPTPGSAWWQGISQRITDILTLVSKPWLVAQDLRIALSSTIAARQPWKVESSRTWEYWR